MLDCKLCALDVNVVLLTISILILFSPQRFHGYKISCAHGAHCKNTEQVDFAHLYTVLYFSIYISK